MNVKIMKVLEIRHYDKNGSILFANKNIDNILHYEGEQFMLKSLFGGLSLPTEYYLGLDSRTTLSRSNGLINLSSLEPSANGYSRQNVATNSFSFISNELGDYQANSPVVLFRASGGTWGPVRNVFLATQAAYAGYLISSVPLGSNITAQDGEIISIRIGLSLRNSSSS